MWICQLLILHVLATIITALSIGATTFVSSNPSQLMSRSSKHANIDLNQLYTSRQGGKGNPKGVKPKKVSGGARPVAAISKTTRTDIDAAVDTKTTSGGKLMIDSVNAFRKEKGLNMLNWSPQLARNAAVTGQATGGKAMEHLMGPGTNGQVLIMGYDDVEGCKRNLNSYTPFELFYYSWLCEVPGDAALKGKCSDVLQRSRINNRGQRGHYDILTSKRFKTIGCAFTTNSHAQKCSAFSGIWACDLGM